MQEDWEAEKEKKILAEEKATNVALIQDFDDIKARIKVDRLLSLRLQEGEREQFTVEERAKFLHDTIAAQRRKRPRPQPSDDSDEVHRNSQGFVALTMLRWQDLFHFYDLVMEQYSEITLEGIEFILWGDLKIMMESSTEENDQSDFWNNQQNWEIVRWRLYEAYGVYKLELKDGIVIHMLVERRYPLSKDLLQMMLDLGLEVEEESTAALHLVKFIKQQLNEE
ncbi:hypothetical protein Tco_0007874 [Tanacetum coccineum]